MYHTNGGKDRVTDSVTILTGGIDVFDLEPIDKQFSEITKLSSHAALELDSVLDELRNLTDSQRTSIYHFGRVFDDARRVIKDDTGSEQMVVNLIEYLGIKKQYFYAAIKVFDVFEPYMELLPNISLSVQQYFGEHKMNEELLQEVIAKARRGKVTYAEFKTQMLSRPETQQRAEEAADEEDDQEPSEASREDEVDRDNAPSPPPAQLPATNGKLSDEALETQRKEFIEQSLQIWKKFFHDLETFVAENRISTLEWYAQVEAGWESALQGLRAWKKVKRL